MAWKKEEPLSVNRLLYLFRIMLIHIFWPQFIREAPLCEKCPYSEFFWYVFSCGKIRTKKILNTDTLHAVLLYSAKRRSKTCLFVISSCLPVDTGRQLNVHKTFRRRPSRLLNVLCTFNLRPVSTGLVQKGLLQVVIRGAFKLQSNV